MVSRVFGRVFGRVLPCGMPFGDEKPHGMPFAVGGKVPTRGFLVKKEYVWCDLTSTGADSRIFGEKGSRVALPLCHFSPLGEKGSWVAQPQHRKVPTRGFSATKETMWRNLPAIFQKPSTRGFSAKKETVWRDLPPKSANSRKFVEKGRRVAPSHE